MGATVKEERIEIRLASAEKERIRQAAVLCHQNVSEFVLRAVRMVADETLAEQTRFVLPADQMSAFYETGRLTSVPSANESWDLYWASSLSRIAVCARQRRLEHVNESPCLRRH